MSGESLLYTGRTSPTASRFSRPVRKGCAGAPDGSFLTMERSFPIAGRIADQPI